MSSSYYKFKKYKPMKPGQEGGYKGYFDSRENIENWRRDQRNSPIHNTDTSIEFVVKDEDSGFTSKAIYNLGIVKPFDPAAAGLDTDTVAPPTKDDVHILEDLTSF